MTVRLQEEATSSGECPTRAELSQFAIGDMDLERHKCFVAHLESCAPCAAALGAHDQYQDELVSNLAHLPEPRTAGNLGASREWIAIARAAIEKSSSDTPELVVDPGRKIAHSLREGPVRLGRFELVEELGIGSFGHVFRAHDTELARTVAIKVQRSPARPHALERERFLREARSAAQLEHPHIVSLYETGETEEGVAYLVTEYIEGQSLQERLRGGPLQQDEAVRLVTRIAMALDAAHEHGVIHRDVKPSNIMLDRQGQPHVMDFGLAKRDVGETTVTPEGALMGTPAYMSPEIARGDAHTVDARCDVYSLGVVLYELLTGERPFHGIRRMLVMQVLEDEPRPPRRLNDKIARDLETICLKAMEKSPARRYASARKLAEDLARFSRGEPIQARSVGVVERLWRWCRRNPLAAGIFVAILAGFALGLWHLTRLSSELVRSSAIESAAQYSEMLEVVNDLYTEEVVDRMGAHGIEATADYASQAGNLPLPATLLNVLLERISSGESGMRGRQYSEAPFRTRPPEQGGGPQSEFEWDALRHLKAEPETPFWRFVDDAGGGPALLYATARPMKESCVGCHNAHADSTKRDWQVGDVGVLEVIRPLDQDIQRTRAGLRSTFVMVALVSLLLLGLSLSIALAGNRRRRLIRAPGARDENDRGMHA